jgi:hypothetical protein
LNDEDRSKVHDRIRWALEDLGKGDVWAARERLVEARRIMEAAP